MTSPPRRLESPLTFWCIGDPEGGHPVFDAGSSVASPGRWNEAETPVIYASEHFAAAMLEKLAHCGREAAPPSQHAVRAVAPAGCSFEMVTPDSLPGWADGEHVSRAFGAAWAREGRSLLLIVPSVVARRERNVIVNPEHPEFARIEAGPEEKVEWDERLFG